MFFRQGEDAPDIVGMGDGLFDIAFILVLVLVLCASLVAACRIDTAGGVR